MTLTDMKILKWGRRFIIFQPTFFQIPFLSPFCTQIPVQFPFLLFVIPSLSDPNHIFPFKNYANPNSHFTVRPLR